MTNFILKIESEVKGKKCILAGLVSMKVESIEKNISEATEIIEKNGSKVVGSIIQRRGVSRSKKPGGSKKMDAPMNAATFIGQGKADELKELVNTQGAEVIVFLNKISGTQKRNLSDLTHCNIIENSNA